MIWIKCGNFTTREPPFVGFVNFYVNEIVRKHRFGQKRNYPEFDRKNRLLICFHIFLLLWQQYSEQVCKLHDCCDECQGAVRVYARRLSFGSQKDKDLVCAICECVMCDPQTSCGEGHVFCSYCLKETKKKRKTCPLCCQKLLAKPPTVPGPAAASESDDLIASDSHRCTVPEPPVPRHPL
eukprot:g56147.t1